jgi:pimeloyl-ACP methyl ester carboxylesterase
MRSPRECDPEGRFSMAEVSVVLVHGAFHSFRCWSGLTPILEGAGVDCRAVDLPNTSMADDVAATWRWIDTVGTPVVLLGHSYGGAVICGAGTHPAVQSLIFLTAAVIDSDECLATSRGGDMISPALAAAMRPTGEDGPLYVDSEAAKDVFYSHCPAPAATAAASQLRPIMPACLAGAIGTAAWRSRPSSYIFTQDDSALSLAAQEVFAAKLDCPTQAIWSDHSPFLSHPQELADLLFPLLKLTTA